MPSAGAFATFDVSVSMHCHYCGRFRPNCPALQINSYYVDPLNMAAGLGLEVVGIVNKLQVCCRLLSPSRSSVTLESSIPPTGCV